MKCPNCNGKGFQEFEAGVIMVECEECHGTGEIPDDNPNTSGDRPDNTNLGSPDTSQPKQHRKRKAKKKASKRSK